MKLFNRIKKSIADFKDWLSPWYPIQIKESAVRDNHLTFEKESGKRFIPRWKKLLNQNLLPILSYGKREYLRQHNAEVDDIKIWNDSDGYVLFVGYNHKVHEYVNLEFWYGRQRIKTVDDVRRCIDHIIYKPEVNLFAEDRYLKDRFGRDCFIKMNYPTEATDYFSGFSS